MITPQCMDLRQMVQRFAKGSAGSNGTNGLKVGFIVVYSGRRPRKMNKYVFMESRHFLCGAINLRSLFFVVCCKRVS